jgi:hypothetical protein
MEARIALRRIVARALMDPDFDATGIADVESLRKVLAAEMARLAAESQQQNAPIV